MEQGKPSLEIPILYRDESICIIDKPADVFVHPNPLDRGAEDCVTNLHQRLGVFVFNVHRLDRPTSGAVVFALDKDSAGELSRQFRDGLVAKRYLALVRGHLRESVRIDLPIPRSKSGERVSASSTARPIDTSVVPEPVGRYDEGWFSLVEIELHTGRFHQARRHLRSIDHPVIGDTSHGDPAQNRYFRSAVGESRLFLRSYRLEFDHPTSGLRVRVVSGAPDWWNLALRRVGLRLPPSYQTDASVIVGGSDPTMEKSP